MNIIGVGNVLMGDDGVGPAAVEALARRGCPPGIALYDAGLACLDVLGGLDPTAALIVIDAVHAGGEPGSIYRAEVNSMAAPDAGVARGLSLHEISVAPALRMEALIGREFRDVTVFGVEPDTLEWGAPLSPAVAGAVDRLVEAVLDYAGATLAGTVVGDWTR